MTGLSISRAHEGPVVRRTRGATAVVSPVKSAAPALELDQLSDFCEFFAPALSLVGSLYWVLQDVMFSPPESWDRTYDPVADRYSGPEWEAFFAEEIVSHNTTRLVRPGFLEKYARYFVDDWCKLLGLGETPADPGRFLAGLRGEQVAAWLPLLRPRVEVAFFCIDGVRWEVFAHDSALISRVRESLASRRDLRIVDTTLSETVA